MQLSLVLSAGLLLIWAGERIVDSSEARWALTGVGVLLVVLATALRFMKANATPAGSVHRTLGFLHVGVLVSLALYALQSDLFAKAAGGAMSASSPKLAGVLAALWPALMLASILPTLFVELSFISMVKSPTLESGRVNEALLSGFGLAGAFVFAFSTQYVTTERDTKVDLSYFRVAKPGEATKKLAASLDEPVNVYLFFPPASDAADAVQEYFDDLKVSAPQMTVTRLDHALEPVKAKEIGATGNGNVIIKKGGRKETLFIGTEAEKAKSQLRGLDAEVNKKLTLVAKSKRTVYLTGGHGERLRNNADSNDQRTTIESLYKVLTDQNFDARPLSIAEGLGSEIPKDAAAVFIIGPTRDFEDPEAAALAKYVDGGGRLFIALEPEAGVTFANLLTPLGLTFSSQIIAQERGTANVRPPPSAADHHNIATRTFSSHPITTYLGRGQSPVLFLTAGSLEEAKQHPADLTIDFAVRSLTDAWNDANSNFEFDTGEVRKAYGEVAAVERKQESKTGQKPSRVIVMADSDAVADLVLANVVGNQYLLVDSFKWLLGDEALAGPTNSEADIPLNRSKQEDALWFYGTTFLAPLAVVGIGFFARRRGKKTSSTGSAK